MKIQAWENHQKAKTEAEMRKIEVNITFKIKYDVLNDAVYIIVCLRVLVNGVPRC